MGVLACLCFTVLHQVYVTATHPDAVYMDTLRLISQVDGWQSGNVSLHDLWAQGSHRGLVFQMLLWLNMHVFGLDVLLSNRLTGLLILATASLLTVAAAQAFSPASDRASRTWVVVPLVLLIPALLFGLTGFELLTLDLGLGLWLKNLLIVGYFAMHARFLRRAVVGNGTRLSHALGILAAGALLALLVTMGWSYAFVGALVGVHLLVAFGSKPRLPLLQAARTAIPVMGLLLLLAVLMRAGGGVGGDVSLGDVVKRVPELPTLLAYCVGSAWMGVEAAQRAGIPMQMIGVLGAVTIVLAVGMLVARVRRGLTSSTLLPLYLLAYGSLTAFSVCIARGDAGPGGVMASRYYMDIVLFQVGVLWLTAEWCASATSAHGWMRIATYAAYSTLIAGALWVAYRAEWATAPFRRAAFEAMNEATLAGVPDAASAQLLQSPMHDARSGVQAMRRLRLGVFANPIIVRDCDAGAIRRVSGWHGEEATGRWMTGRGRLSIPGCACPLSMELYTPEGFKPRTLSVLDVATGQVMTLPLVPGVAQPLRLPANSQAHSLELSVNLTTLPVRDLPGGIDQRELGVFVSKVAYACPR